MTQKIAKTLPWIAIGFMTAFSGCNYATSENPGRVYGDTSASAPATSPTANSGSDVAAAPEGEARSEVEGEVIVPEEAAAVPTPPAPGGVVDDGVEVAETPVETPSTETPTVVGTIDPDTLVDRPTLPGGVVLSDPPVVTLPPTVSCDEPSFAFVSKRSGAQNILVQKQGLLRTLTSNETAFRSYKNLTMRRGGQDFAADENILAVIIPIIRTLFGTLEAPAVRETIPGDAIAVRSFAWNHAGDKAAYLKTTRDRSYFSTAIHYVTNLATLETRRDMVIDPSGHHPVGKLAWWGNYIVYETTSREETTIGMIDPERVPAYFQAIHVESGAPLTHDSPKLVGSQPAVSAGGTLAYVEQDAGGKRIVAACELRNVSAMGSTFRQCVGRRVIAATGNNHSPAWSPDGRWIYFVSDRDGNQEIYRIRPDGTGEERLTNDPAADTSPAPFAPYAGCE